MHTYLYNVHTNSLEYWNDMKISFANIGLGPFPSEMSQKKHLLVRDSLRIFNRSTFQPIGFPYAVPVVPGTWTHHRSEASKGLKQTMGL